MYLGIVGSATAFLLHTADTNSLLDISNIFGDTPGADSHAPESLFIARRQPIPSILYNARTIICWFSYLYITLNGITMNSSGNVDVGISINIYQSRG